MGLSWDCPLPVRQNTRRCLAGASRRSRTRATKSTATAGLAADYFERAVGKPRARHCIICSRREAGPTCDGNAAWRMYRDNRPRPVWTMASNPCPTGARRMALPWIWGGELRRSTARSFSISAIGVRGVGRECHAPATPGSWRVWARCANASFKLGTREGRTQFIM